MDFSLTEEQKAFQQSARAFAESEMAPYAKSWDENHIFPVDTLRRAAALGFAGICVRSEFGGSQLTRLDSAIIFSELSRACVSTAAYLSIHNMVAWLIDHYANDSLRAQWLPRLTTMELFASYCLTEPNAGSDAASLKTTAVREGDMYVLNGSKAFISGGSTSDVYVCMVRTGGAGPKGISCLLIPKETPGLSFGKKEMKLGWHSQTTTMVFFENCRVPVSHLIGKEGEGFTIALSALNGGRINIAACSLGGASQCFDLAKQHILEREQFQKKLAEFQVIQFKLADAFTHLETARLITYKAAVALDQADPDAAMYCAMAKRYATDRGFEICNEALQIFGGYGYLSDYPLERYFRDLRVHQILEGTNEIMRVIIAKRLLAV